MPFKGGCYSESIIGEKDLVGRLENLLHAFIKDIIALCNKDVHLLNRQAEMVFSV
jgi:hypothetical protein